MQGLCSGWKPGDITASKPPTHLTSQQLDPEGDTSIEFDFGGFGNEDEGNEQLRMLNNPSKPLKVKSIAMVVQTVHPIYVFEPF